MSITMKPHLRRLSFVVFFVLASSSASAQSQQQAPQEPVTSLVQTVEPSFRIEPIVHRFEGRRGEVIPFEFVITSLGKAMNLKVTPVNLRQEESGIILHDQTSKPSDVIKFTSPSEFNLEAGKTTKIAGELSVPIAKTNYLSYGILVQDIGQKPNFESIGNKASTTKAGIRFVTQYVLRLDIDTGSTNFQSFEQLRLQQGTIVSEQGKPMVRAYLENPTNLAFECQVRAAVASPTSKKPRPFLLGMPSRAALEGSDRHLVRIMPKSRLRLEAPIDSPLFHGAQTLKLGLSNGRREVVQAEFPTEVDLGQFPALATQLAYVGKGLVVSPSQIELGTIRDTKRTLGITFLNNADVDQNVAIKAQTFSGEGMQGVRFSPQEFTIRAGRTKSVRVLLQSTNSTSLENAGHLEIKASTDTSTYETTYLPLAIRKTSPTSPNLSTSEIALVSHLGKPAFQLTVQNRSSNFVPINADLEILNARGRSIHLSAGYGKWIAPSQEVQLTFTPDQQLDAGQYQLTLALKTHNHLPPETKTLDIQLQAPSSQASRQWRPASARAK